MVRLKGFVLVLVLVAAVPLAAFSQESVAGDWDITLTTPQGPNIVRASFTVDGSKVTGTLTSAMGSAPIAGTTTTGSDLHATASVEVQGMVLDVAFDGKLAGAALNGTVKVGDFEFPFTGARAAAKTAAAAAVAAPNAPVSTDAAPPPTGAGGKWNIVMNIPGVGEFPATAVLNQTAEKVTGTLSSSVGEIALVGTMVGNTLKIDFTAQTPQGDIAVTMTGTLGATGFTGTASIEGMGDADWIGTRAQQ